MMELEFLGGAQTVTGSKYLVKNNDTAVLVDCGLFQGTKSLRLLNWEKLPVDAANLEAVLLTHAYLDHCGALPLLVKQGFKGPIYCTAPTLELTKIVLADAAKIQEEEAEYANRKKFSKHNPALPLYDIPQAEAVFPLLKTIHLNHPFSVGSLEVEYHSAGHILGACSVRVSGEKTLYFSGDLGRFQDPLMPPPSPPVACDVLVMESTYGNRNHSSQPSKEVLKECILDVVKNKGVLLIPSFSVGRAQNLLQEIIHLKRSQEIPESVPVFFNSPMGLLASDLYAQYAAFTRLAPGEFDNLRSEVREIQDAEQSIQLNESKDRPLVIIAASGMLTGGRVLHHLRAFAGDPKCILLLAGYQAAGTRGRDLADGKRQIKVHGALRDVHCQVITADSFSAHADQAELMQWLRLSPQAPEKIFLVHGETDAATTLALKIREELQWDAQVAEPASVVTFYPGQDR